MAKRHRLALLPLAAGLGAAYPAQAAWDFAPQAMARATYSDNITLQADERAERGLVTQLSPGFQLSNHSHRFDFTFDYALNLFQYSGGRPASALRHSQSLSSKLKSSLVDELLYLDANANVSQQAVSAFGPLQAGNAYAGNNRSEVRTYSISPYLVHRFGAVANGELRYTHDAFSTDNFGMRRSDGNSISALLNSGPSFRRFGWNLNLMRTVVEEELAGSKPGANQQTTSSKMANLGLHYAATPQLDLGVFGGYDAFDFSGLGGAQSGAAYGANLKWVPSARTSLQASLGHRFYGPSYNLALEHRSRGTVWNITYSDAVSTTRSQFLLPQAIDTAAMLDNLFRSRISDPQLRAAAVQAYINTAGLPPSLATSVNFFSNRYALQKQLNASVAWQLARTTTMFTLYKSRREMLSSQQLDSDLLGSSLSLFNDNTQQVGATASLSYRMGAQSVLTLVGNATNVTSLSSDRNNRHRDLRLTMTHNYSTRLSGNLELRHVKGSLGAGGQNYTENAVTAVLSSKF